MISFPEAENEVKTITVPKNNACHAETDRVQTSKTSECVREEIFRSF